MKRDRETLRQTPLLSNSTYDVLKWVATIFLPAFGALYFGLAQIWGLPAAEEVVGTTVVVDTFLGVLLGLSTRQYDNSEAKYDGAFIVNENAPEDEPFRLEMDVTPEELADKKDITIRVEKL